MRDHARDWSEQGRQPRGEPTLCAAVPLVRSSLSITVERKERGCVQSIGTLNGSQSIASLE